MERLRAKLKSESGASILLALAFFLLCLTVGGVILTAATASAGRLASQRQTQQDYLTVSSAASALRDALDAAAFTATVTTVDGGESANGYSLSTAVTTPLGPELKNAVITMLGGQTPESKPLTVRAADLDEVAGVFSLDSRYTIKITLSLTDEDGDSRQPMTLIIPAVVEALPTEVIRETFPVDTGEKDADGNPIMGEGTKVTVIETRRVTWSEGTITKGAAG